MFDLGGTELLLESGDAVSDFAHQTLSARDITCRAVRLHGGELCRRRHPARATFGGVQCSLLRDRVGNQTPPMDPHRFVAPSG